MTDYLIPFPIRFVWSLNIQIFFLLDRGNNIRSVSGERKKMDDFYKLLNKYRIEGTFCDVALWAKCPTNPENVMGPYSAHKVVLAATCPSLASVMTSQVRQKKQRASLFQGLAERDLLAGLRRDSPFGS